MSSMLDSTKMGVAVGDLGKTVGTNQKQIRTERGLSLEALAAMSGVSRSNLAQIESGKANPSIATVWQIASALKVGFSELVTTSDDASQVVDIPSNEPSVSEDGSYRAYPVFAFDPALGFELFACEMDAGSVLEAAPHPGGTQETITVIDGELSLEFGGEQHTLCANQAIRFRADQLHEYRNSGERTVRFSTIVAYSRRG